MMLQPRALQCRVAVIDSSPVHSVPPPGWDPVSVESIDRSDYPLRRATSQTQVVTGL